MSGTGAAGLVGAAVGLGVWLALRPGGRTAVVALGGGGDPRDRPWFTMLGTARARLASGPHGDDGARVRVVVAQVSALLRAGAPPGAAWTRAAGVDVDEVGVPDERALAAVVGPEAARSVTAATRLAVEVGAPLGRVLESVSDTLVAQAEARSEREAALSGPRTTARVLLWLPAAGALLGGTLGADPLARAADGGAGTAAVGLGLVLLAVGRWWTGRLVTAARQAGEAS
ncbi:hypothetical protein DNL40_14900 [Xylanimonas oleitrophica]|uniref:Tight adherence protein B n=1 Tax=Xylanimonas oleitrophica TaxID=2607479 RepID=A0A2W5YCF1_9MICO|nr:type II secretion system F family protein [Xylanimonas oleitrophica]PZR51791.1 hypothetical protein DNL40_14900 [Xylanimonas oleitrophica]